jgi:chorismate mutase
MSDQHAVTEALLAFRGDINALDEQIVRLLGRRYEICREVAHFKREHGIPMMQPSRVAEVKERCARMAAEHNIDPDFARRLYGLIIDEACRMEDDIIDGTQLQSAATGP